MNNRKKKTHRATRNKTKEIRARNNTAVER